MLDVKDSDDSDSDDVVPQSRKRDRKQFEESSEEDAPVSHKRLRKSRQTPAMSQEERQELDEDVLDLALSGSDSEIRRPKPPSARQQAMALLKRKRKGRGAPVDAVASENGDDQDERDEGYSGSSSPTYREIFAEDDDDDEGFVIEDDDALLGAPVNLPIALSRHASKKAKDLFAHAIEWMVQKRINPAFPGDDDLYVLAFRKLDDEAAGLAGSKFKSSAWTQEFTFALQTRPDMVHTKSVRHVLTRKCDACNREGHPATAEIQFQGRPYDRHTLDDTDDNDRDSNGRLIPAEDASFAVGKTCFANAETAHALEHWRHHLYQEVLAYLDREGYNSDKKVLKRDKMNASKRQRYANNIVDRMKSTGEISSLWHVFKSSVDKARTVQHGRWRGSA